MEDPIIEEIAEDVHKGWMAEKQKQGFADHAYEPALLSEGRRMGKCTYMNCTVRPEVHHPDMLPYAELADNVKEYDRATARAVIQGLERRGYVIRSSRGEYGVAY